MRHWGVSFVKILSLWIVFLHFQISKLWAGWRWKVGGREEKDKINDSPSGNINFPFAPMLTCGWNQNGSNKTKRLHCNENKTEKRKKPKNSSFKNLILIWRLNKSPLFSFQKILSFSNSAFARSPFGCSWNWWKENIGSLSCEPSTFTFQWGTHSTSGRSQTIRGHFLNPKQGMAPKILN